MRYPAILAVPLTSCASLSNGARDDFSKAMSYPVDRVTVVSRPDYAVPMPPAPPADIAADPGRLAIWQKQQDSDRNASAHPNCGEMFAASGCGQQLMVCCTHPWSGADAENTGGPDRSQVSCGHNYPLP